jgi:hypothetical protein
MAAELVTRLYSKAATLVTLISRHGSCVICTVSRMAALIVT